MSILGPLENPGRADQAALIDAASTRTWADVVREISGAAGAMSAAGDDERWGVLGDNAGETLLAHVAGLFAGVGTVALSRQSTLAELADQIEDARIIGLIAGPIGAGVAMSALEAGLVDTVVLHGIPPNEEIRSTNFKDAAAAPIDWSTWIDTAPAWDQRPRPSRPPMVYTSGTTGRARATEVRWVLRPTVDHVDYLTVLRERAQFPAGAHLVVGPLQHNGPLAAVRHLVCGEPVVVMSRFDAAETLHAIELHKVTSSVMVPTHFQRLLALADDVRLSYDLSSLRLIAHTGSSCPEQVKRDMIEWLGPILLESYGGSESGTLCRITSAEWLSHPGSVGRAVEPYRVRVFTEDGAELGVGAIGVLGFEAPEEYGLRYHRDAEKTARAYVRPGVFTLGDVGYVDEDGFVFVTDRVSDMVVSGGVNLYPSESEAALRTHPEVIDVAVIGIPHPDLGEQLLALIVPADPAHPPTTDQLVAHCRDRLSSYKIPRRMEFIVELPRNEMQKVDKKALRSPYWTEQVS